MGFWKPGDVKPRSLPTDMHGLIDDLGPLLEARVPRGWHAIVVLHDDQGGVMITDTTYDAAARVLMMLLSASETPS